MSDRHEKCLTCHWSNRFKLEPSGRTAVRCGYEFPPHPEVMPDAYCHRWIRRIEAKESTDA